MALLRYTLKHQWLSLDDDILTVGISHQGRVEVGEILEINLPQVGTALVAGKDCVALKSDKAEATVQAPLAGEVIEVNSEIGVCPSIVNLDPEGRGWMLRMRLPKKDGFDDYLMPRDYHRFVIESLGI
jgi:glycine cleavage system H protein